MSLPCPTQWRWSRGRVPTVPRPQEAELSRQERLQAQEVRAQRARGEAEAARAQALADVEASRVREVAAALGPETIRDIARAGPELQVRGGGHGEGGCVCRVGGALLGVALTGGRSLRGRGLGAWPDGRCVCCSPPPR